MQVLRAVVGAGLLLLETGLAVLGVVMHYGLTAEYGDVTDSVLQGWLRAFTAGVGGMALGIVAAVALVTMMVSARRWVRLSAVGIPVLMLGGMLAATPPALQHKLDAQYTTTPQCVPREDMGPGPATRAARESQRAFESIEHVGLFSRGGGSGVGGCDRSFVLTEEVDVLGHYRDALPAAGWRVVTDRSDHLRAERAGMAFEVIVCERGGTVWAGESGTRDKARCDPDAATVTGTG